MTISPIRQFQSLLLLGAASTVTALANDAPEISIHVGGNETFFWDQEPIRYIVVVSDTEDGDSLSGSLDRYSVAVEFQYVEDGYAAFEPAFADAGAVIGATRGRELVEGDDCFLCHSERASGPTAIPTFAAIADKFQGDLSVAPALAYNIVNGAQGIWGSLLMPAHTASMADATAMAQYVLSFHGDAPARMFLPVSGAVTPDVGGQLVESPFGPELTGRFLLTASYTDRGRETEAPATSRAVLPFRYPNVPVAELADVTGFERMQHDGMNVLVSAEEPSSARLGSIDLTGIRNVSIATLGSARRWPGGAVELRVDAPDGPLIGSIEVAHASRQPQVHRAATRIEAVRGKRELFLVAPAGSPVAIGAICFECSY